MSPKFGSSLCLILTMAAFTVCHAMGQTADVSLAATHRVEVPEAVTSSLLTHKTPLTYPDAARNAGIQGVVVLKVVVADTGEVKEVSTISGDPLLAQPAADVVRQWKYKPYILDGTPVEMETQLSLNFHLKTPEHGAPSLGVFNDEKYSNEFFDFQYPLTRDWVRETQVMRTRFSADGQSPGTYVLLAAVHIPPQTVRLEADSSFVLSALAGGDLSCEQYLQAVADGFHSGKKAKQRGKTTAVTIAGRNFYRADFDFAEDPGHRTFLCTESKGYLLQWNIGGLSKDAIESTISTLNSISALQPSAPAPRTNVLGLTPSAGIAPKIDRVRVSQRVTQGLALKRVRPVYPQQARYEHIQGSVVMSAVISKSGDVADLEVLQGPIELVVSAVNAVRQWKYRPYTLQGKPVEVDTQITVNYTLSP